MQTKEALQRRCAMFHACLELFKAKFPSEFTAAECPNIVKALLGFTDYEVDKHVVRTCFCLMYT